MNRAFPDYQPEPGPDPDGALFGVSLDQLDPELVEPLAALRRSLYELGELLDDDPERAALLGQAMENLDKVDLCANTVAAFASPAKVEGESCTIAELAELSIGKLPEALRDSVWLTPDDQLGSLNTDPDLLSSSLACLLEEVLCGSDGEVLLHAHSAANVAYFSIVESKPLAEHDAPAAAAALLARRDLERLGAEVSVRLHDPSHRCVTVRIPLETEPEA